MRPRRLYIIPSVISPAGLTHIPQVTVEIIHELRVFIVEKPKTAKRFIRNILPDFDFKEVNFFDYKGETDAVSLFQLSKVFEEGRNIGLLSEAGFPCIADPGASVVNMARKYNYEIKPLTGPSSILLTLAASGLNGQKFCFHGYLPVNRKALKSKLIEINKDALKFDTSHIFMETPYRNQRLLSQICEWVNDNIYLCIGMDLTGTKERIEIKKISMWRGGELDQATPAIFIIGKIQ